MTTSRARGRLLRGRAFTLVELVTALVMASVLLLAMGGAMVAASKAIPDKNDPLRSSVQAAQAIDQIGSEVELALYISQLTSKSIAFTVADRDGDGLPERIVYSWTGVSGDPLLRTYNGGAATPIVDAVNSFNLVPNVRYTSETYPAVAVEDSASTLLQDCTATSGLSSQSMGSSNVSNFGQYFLPTFTPDIVAWRPTSVSFRAMLNRTPGSFRVQMRPGSAAQLKPLTTILGDQLVNSSTLTSVMTTYAYNFAGLPRLSPSDPICMAVMWDSGQNPVKLESNSTQGGLVKTSSTPTTWSYLSNNCLSAQISGVAMRATGSTLTATTQYLLSLGISLRAGSSASPITQTSALALNHPEIVAGLWELKFDRDPTKVDANGDGTGDWSLASGGTFNTGSLSVGVWSNDNDTLWSKPSNEFNAKTIVDLRMQSTLVGGSAGFFVNAARAAGQCVPLTASMSLQADGTQTLTISQLVSDTTSVQLIAFGQIPAGWTDVHLIIDPTALGVSVSINTVSRGTFPITRVQVSDQTKSAALFASGGGAKFSYARLRVLGGLSL